MAFSDKHFSARRRWRVLVFFGNLNANSRQQKSLYSSRTIQLCCHDKRSLFRRELITTTPPAGAIKPIIEGGVLCVFSVVNISLVVSLLLRRASSLALSSSFKLFLFAWSVKSQFFLLCFSSPRNSAVSRVSHVVITQTCLHELDTLR